MNSSANIPEVLDDEWLARFIFSRRHFRAPDLTVKPEAFSPPLNLEFSVNRHLELTEEELWTIGRAVGTTRPDANLYGRADLQATTPRKIGLHVKSAPMDENSGHAILIGWPSDKPSQMIIQQQLAQFAKYLPSPDLGS